MRGLKRYKMKNWDESPVASFTDAWIETISKSWQLFRLLSHLLQMRGLKLLMSIDLWRKKSVASFTDAWIETLQDEKLG